MFNPKKVLLIQHIHYEWRRRVQTYLDQRSHQFQYKLVRTFRRTPYPKNMDEFDAMVILGGSMMVDDRHIEEFSFLNTELDLMQQALDDNKPVLGICLGGQMLAHLLGAEIFEGPTEVGWIPIRIKQEDPLFNNIELSTTEENTFYLFQVHKQGWKDIPKGVCLGSGDDWPNQITRYKNSIAIQGHPDMTLNCVRQLVEERWEIAQAGYTGNAQEFLSESASLFPLWRDASIQLIDNFFEQEVLGKKSMN